MEANDAVTVASMTRPRPFPNEALSDLAVSAATKLQCFRVLSPVFSFSWFPFPFGPKFMHAIYFTLMTLFFHNVLNRKKLFPSLSSVFLFLLISFYVLFISVAASWKIL